MKNARLVPIFLALSLPEAVPLPVSGATISWTNTAGGNWSLANNWSPHQVPRETNDVVITANGTYTVTLNQDATIASLTLGGSSGTNTLLSIGHNLTLTNSGVINPRGVLKFSGGGARATLDCAPGLAVNGQTIVSNVFLTMDSSLTITAGGMLNIGGQFLVYAPLTNYGTVNQIGGRAVVGNDNGASATGVAWNEPLALWDIQGDQNLDGAGNGALEQFHNLGTLRKSSGTGTAQISAYLDNQNKVEAQMGLLSVAYDSSLGGHFVADAGATIDLNGGSYTAGTATSFSGAGTNEFVAGNLTLTDGVPPNLQLNGGTVWLSPQFQGGTITNLNLTGASLAGTNVVTGSLLMDGGEIIHGPVTVDSSAQMTLTNGRAYRVIVETDSGLTVASGGVLIIAGEIYLFGPLTNSGTVNWQSGRILVENDTNVVYTGVIWNKAGASWDVQCDGFSLDGSYNQFDSTLEQFHNVGGATLRKSAGTGTTAINVYLDNKGMLDAQSGVVGLAGNYSLAGGTLNFGLRDTNDFGSINIAGNAVLAGAVSANLRPGYSVNPGDTFPAITFGSRSGVFSNFSLPSEAVWQTNYNPGDLTLTVVALTSSNSPPILPVISDQTTVELTLLTVTNTAISPGYPVGQLAYALVNPPAGASINTNGIITWTPSEAQGPGIYTIFTIASNTVSGLAATNSFTAQATEETSPPVLTVPGNQTVAANQTLSVSCSATNPQVPSDPLSFSLVTAPSNMTINATSGAILWTPTPAQAPSTNSVQVRVADSDDPALSDTKSFLVIVSAPVTNAPGQWTSKAELPWPAFTSQAVELGGVLYAVGGWSGCTPYSDLAAYDPASDTWSAKAPMHVARGYHAAAALNGKIYVVGGDVDCGADIASVEAYDPVLNSWTNRAPLPVTRVDGRAGVVNGILYYFGGSRTFDGEVFAYDPAADAWSQKAPIPTPRNDISVAVAGGSVYVMGGVASNGVTLALVEVYDPASDTWRAGTPMPSPRSSFCSAVLDGLIYVIGGANSVNTQTASVDAYNPATDTWTPVAPMPAPRTDGPAAAVGGTLYVIGGYSPVGGYISSMLALTPGSTPFSFDASPGSPQMTGTGFHLRLQGLAGHGTVVIYASDNLSAWTPIYTNPPGPDSLDFLDSTATNHPARFYRATGQ